MRHATRGALTPERTPQRWVHSLPILRALSSCSSSCRAKPRTSHKNFRTRTSRQISRAIPLRRQHADRVPQGGHHAHCGQQVPQGRVARGAQGRVPKMPSALLGRAGHQRHAQVDPGASDEIAVPMISIRAGRNVCLCYHRPVECARSELFTLWGCVLLASAACVHIGTRTHTRTAGNVCPYALLPTECAQ